MLLNNTDSFPGIPSDIVADFVAGALPSILSSWLKSGMERSPREIAEMFCKMAGPRIMRHYR